MNCNSRYVKTDNIEKDIVKIGNSASLRTKLINYGSEVNAGAQVNKADVAGDYLLKTMEYVFKILSGSDVDSNSNSSDSKDSINLLATEDAVNCSITEPDKRMCPFLPTSHVKMARRFSKDSEVQRTHKEILKLLVDHEADVNMSNCESFDNDFHVLNATRKLLLQFGNGVNLENEETMEATDREKCTFLEWLMIPGSQVNNLENLDGTLLQEGVKIKLRRLINHITASGNEVNSNVL